ncbi:RagB/SusD family nutrient uptake outer membrane protein, partial [Pseudomonas frederiksbergensis]|nr:RagB/SusD family nutrient uptake outer membrane protein [Pseudomonas frederiksbergensis]
VVNPGDEDLYKARDPRTLVADNMLRDIDQAIEWLPMKSKVDVTRISKDAALALKARFCLFEGTWRRYHKIEGDTKFLQEAYNAAGELMKSEYG